MDLLRHLRFFAAVAEQRHFGRAADELGMTQPPVSQGVQRLERHLGQTLFVRSARGVTLTSAGHALLPGALAALAAADAVLEEARLWRPERPVRIGLAEDLDHLVDDLVGSVPGDLMPMVAGTADLIGRLREGALDVAVCRHPHLLDGLRAGPVRVLRADGDPLDPDLPLLVPPRRQHPAAHDQLLDALRRDGHPGDVVELPSSADRSAWAAARRGVRWLPGAPGLPAARYRVVTDPHAVADEEIVARTAEVAAALDAGLAGREGG
ncbi:LysR family transcriptional regulator [Alteromonas gracilis]